MRVCSSCVVGATIARLTVTAAVVTAVPEANFCGGVGGRVLLVGNHAGQLPFDAAMLAVGMLLEAEPPRLARGLGEYWIPRLPFVSEMAAPIAK